MEINLYEWLKKTYPILATIQQCEKAVEIGKITKEQFKEITKLDYSKQK